MNDTGVFQQALHPQHSALFPSFHRGKETGLVGKPEFQVAAITGIDNHFRTALISGQQSP